MTRKELFDCRPQVKKKRVNRLPENPEQKNAERAVGLGRFPSWLHRKLPKGGALSGTGTILSKNRLHTVCEEAKCPNLMECWSRKTATFLVLGKACTRRCGFCDIDFTLTPSPPDPSEPERVAQSVKELGLKHVVITMVARDDLPDGGGAHLADIIFNVRKKVPGATIEVLTSDFSGHKGALDAIIDASPEVFNHNLETVRALTPRVRHRATYERTLDVLRYVAEKKGPLVKSGIMVGLGESLEQVEETLRDLKETGCTIVTIGQYLQADRNKLAVKRFVTPEEFKHYNQMGKTIGIPHVFSGPFVRSSYNADLVLAQAQ